MSSPIAKIQAKARGLTEGLTKNLKVMDGQLTKTTGAINKVGATIAGVAVGAGAGIYALSKTGMDFEHTLASLAAVAKPTQDELAAISKSALQVGSDFGFSSIEVA